MDDKTLENELKGLAKKTTPKFMRLTRVKLW